MTSSDVEVLLTNFEQGKYKNYLGIYNYDKITGNIFFDFKNKI